MGVSKRYLPQRHGGHREKATERGGAVFGGAVLLWWVACLRRLLTGPDDAVDLGDFGEVDAAVAVGGVEALRSMRRAERRASCLAMTLRASLGFALAGVVRRIYHRGKKNTKGMGLLWWGLLLLVV